MQSKLLAIFMTCCAVFFPTASYGQSVKVYNGITKTELVSFAKSQGWEVMGGSLSELTVVFRIGGQTASISLHDCNEDARCGSGFIRTVTFYSIKNKNYFRRVNRISLGATGFGPHYITLQRHLHFRGITDTYLREVIGKVWVEASKTFFKSVGEQSKKERAK